jgi:O-acetyl-ADP-ribose deacetylase (regulator of RNase III)
MEVTLVQRSIYDLPSKRRVGAIVFDGAADMQLWPGPGPERELQEHYGDGLQRALDNELRQVEGQRLPLGAVIRVHPGRLHCDFLAWVASRPPEPGTTRSPAPPAEVLREGVLTALRFAAERSVERIAFPALGAGPQELGRPDRLALIVEAAHAYQAERKKAGRPPVVEEVFVCEPAGPVFREAKRRIGDKASAEEKVLRPPEQAGKKQRRRRLASKTGGKKSSKARSRKPKLTAEEALKARDTGLSYSMRTTFEEGDLFMHSKFGAGKVVGLPAPGQILCVFEDGSERKLVHGRT